LVDYYRYGHQYTLLNNIFFHEVLVMP